jgi:hypothetical protein
MRVTASSSTRLKPACAPECDDGRAVTSCSVGPAGGRLSGPAVALDAWPLRHNHVVPWRRFLLFAVLLLVAASLVSAMTPQERRSGNSPSSQVEAPPASPPSSEIEATLPSTKEVRARVGDVVRLTVRAPSDDLVQVTELGLERSVDAGLPAELVFVADQPGRFRVRLRDAREAVGTLRIAG